MSDRKSTFMLHFRNNFGWSGVGLSWRHKGPSKHAVGVTLDFGNRECSGQPLRQLDHAHGDPILYHITVSDIFLDTFEILIILWSNLIIFIDFETDVCRSDKYVFTCSLITFSLCTSNKLNHSPGYYIYDVPYFGQENLSDKISFHSAYYICSTKTLWKLAYAAFLYTFLKWNRWAIQVPVLRR